MKKLFVILLPLLAVLLFSCIKDNSSSITNSISENAVVLPPPSTSYIVIVDKDGNRFETEIQDKVLDDGTRISQKIQDCINNSRNHGDFISCMAHLTNWLMKNGYITNKEKGILMNIAARANLP